MIQPRAQVESFSLGARYALRGIGEFYAHPRYWKYALLPLAGLFAVYALSVWWYWRTMLPWMTGWIGRAEGSWAWLEVILTPLRWFVWGTALVIFLLFLAMMVNTLFEMAGGLFFEGLCACFERGRYGLEPVKRSWKRGWLWNGECAVFGIVTFLIWLALWLIGWWIPLAGPVLLVVCVGYRYAQSYIFSAGFNRNLSIGAQRVLLRPHRGVVRGFGAMLYLVMLVPVIPVFFIPGLVLGGSMLLHESVLGEVPRTGAPVPAALPEPKKSEPRLPERSGLSERR